MSSSQLIVQDFQGINNGDLGKTSARLMKGASWKRQRIVVVIPAAETIPAKVYLSHINLGFPPNNSVFRILAMGQEVGEAYSNAIESVLAHPDLSQFEFLLLMEHDNCPPSDGVIQLLEQMEAHPEFAGLSGLYFTKGMGMGGTGAGCAQIWGDVKDPILNFRPQPPDPNGGLVECCGLGNGFTMFRLSMFKDERLRKPWFKTAKGPEGYATQDLWFAQDARKYGYRFAVHCGCRVGHYDMKGDFGPADMMY